uniref:Uncharacterized protein n=1 Tax=Caenorhabditis tropicalis TaxID=1561998 RepID=A0A1I7UJP6_9PELO
MGKKRKHQDSFSSDDKKIEKRMKNEELEINGITSLNIVDSTFQKVFLIKKPIGVTLQDLTSLKWSSGDGELLSKTKVKTDHGSYRAVVTLNNKKDRMVLLPAKREREDGDSKNIKAQSFVHGSITILPQEIKNKHLGGSVYEEGDEPIHETAPHPNLRRIRKVAVLDLKSRCQRNKAYGITTDNAGNLRRLPNLIKN